MFESAVPPPKTRAMVIEVLSHIMALEQPTKGRLFAGKNEKS